MFIKTIIRRITHWESWPFLLLYGPVIPVWIWYMVRSRSFWFFTPSNPGITFGGMEGEPKKEMYALLPDELYPETVFISPDFSFEEVLSVLSGSGIRFPFIAKPEVGEQGIMLRKIDDEDSLRRYHSAMTREYIIQQLVTYPMEVSVFYIRHPQHPKGKVTGFLHKVPMHVKGNGEKTLCELCMDHPKASSRMEELSLRHGDYWGKIIPAGVTYQLSYAANHNRGAHFADLSHHINDRLVSHFDAISHRINDFFYGRYDIMCRSVEDLTEGKEFLILEYNGCGAEPNHFYDTGYTLSGAYREILMHWRALYEISAFNRKNGIRPWPFGKGIAFIMENRKVTGEMKKLDRELL